MKTLVFFCPLLALATDPSNSGARRQTPSPVGGRASLTVPTPPQEACEALLTCDTPATLLAEGDWNDRYVAESIEANDYAVFISAPQDYPMTENVRVFTQNENTWFDAGWLSARGLAASGDLLVTGTTLGADIFQCGIAGCSTRATIDRMAYPVATNSKEVALSSPDGETWIYSQDASGNWFVSGFVAGPVEPDCDRMTFAMDENRLAIASCTKVYVFVRTGLDWSFEQELTWPGIQFSVRALALKGSSILVGAPRQCVGPVCAAVYAFDFVNGDWEPAQRLVAEDSDFYSRFGTRLALKDDYAIIGAPLQRYPGWSFLGAVHVYLRSANHWVLAKTIRPPFWQNSSNFGFALATSGNKLLVGAPTEDCGGNCNGQVYAYDLTGNDCDCDEVADLCEVDDDLDGIIACDECPESVIDEFLMFGTCDTGVHNNVFDNGCTMADMIAECERKPHHSPMNYPCINELISGWRREGLIDADEARRIHQCFGGKQKPPGTW